MADAVVARNVISVEVTKGARAGRVPPRLVNRVDATALRRKTLRGKAVRD